MLYESRKEKVRDMNDLCFFSVPGMFKTNGQMIPGTMCDHQFVSSQLTPQHGRFYSPRYPSSYPKNIRCSYHFRARYVTTRFYTHTPPPSLPLLQCVLSPRILDPTSLPSSRNFLASGSVQLSSFLIASPCYATAKLYVIDIAYGLGPIVKMRMIEKL